MKAKSLLVGSMLLASAMSFANNNPKTNDANKTEASKKVDIVGGVFHTESRKPLAQVVITAYLLSRREKTTVTDTNGAYSFDDLKPGTYKLVFEKDGYKKITKDKVLIKTDDGFQMNIQMEEEKDFNFIPGAFDL